MEQAASRLSYLFHRYNAGICTLEEKDEYLRMVIQDHYSEELKALVDKAVTNATDTGTYLNEEEAARVLRGILDTGKAESGRVVSFKKTFHTWKTYVAIAASVILLAATAIWLNTGSSSKEISGLKALPVDKAPGKGGAILTLADGRTVVIDSLGNGIVATQGGAQVLLKNGQLTYTNAASSADVKANSTILYNTLQTPMARQAQFILPDGTKVWLNAASSIKYPVRFDGKTREVEVKGEVYFEVAHNAQKPFRVHFGKVDNNSNPDKEGVIEVLGTHFNINAYSDEPLIKTSLLEGSVRVIRNGITGILKPGEQAQIDEENRLKVVRDIDLNEEVAWKNGLFVVRGSDLKTLMRQLARWYDIEVVQEGVFPAKRYGALINRDVNLSDVIKSLEVYGINSTLENGKLILRP